MIINVWKLFKFKEKIQKVPWGGQIFMLSIFITMRKTFFSVFLCFAKDKTDFFSIFEFALENIQWFCTRESFAKQMRKKMQNSKYGTTVRKYSNLHVRYKNNYYNRHFCPKNVAAVNWPPSIGLNWVQIGPKMVILA